MRVITDVLVALVHARLAAGEIRGHKEIIKSVSGLGRNQDGGKRMPRGEIDQ